jgi:hypothetical protein
MACRFASGIILIAAVTPLALAADSDGLRPNSDGGGRP